MMYLGDSTICSYSAAVKLEARSGSSSSSFGLGCGFAVCGHRCLQLRHKVIQTLLAAGEGGRRLLFRVGPEGRYQIERVEGAIEDDHRTRAQQHGVWNVDVARVGVG